MVNHESMGQGQFVSTFDLGCKNKSLGVYFPIRVESPEFKKFHEVASQQTFAVKRQGGVVPQKPKYARKVHKSALKNLPQAVHAQNLGVSHPLAEQCVCEILRQLVEQEATRQVRNADSPVNRIMVVEKNYGFVAAATIDQQGNFVASVNEEPMPTWTDYICALFNISYPRAVLLLGWMVQMTPTKLCSFTTSRGNETGVKPYSGIDKKIPSFFAIARERAERFYTHLIENRINQVVAAIIWYRGGEHSFCLRASLHKGFLQIGKHVPRNYLVNEQLLLKHPFAKAVLFQDERSALLMQKLLDEVRGYNPDDYIVTSALLDDFSKMPFSLFWQRDVIFVPAPDVEALSLLTTLEKYLPDKEVKLFRVCPRFYLHKKPSASQNSCVSGLSASEQHVLDACHYIEDIEHPIRELARMEAASMPVSDFIALGEEWGIYIKDVHGQLPSKEKDEIDISSCTLGALLLKSPGAGDEILSLEAALGSKTMIYGITNIGKSRLLAYLAGALASGGIFLDLPAEKRHKIVYFKGLS